MTVVRGEWGVACLLGAAICAVEIGGASPASSGSALSRLSVAASAFDLDTSLRIDNQVSIQAPRFDSTLNALAVRWTYTTPPPLPGDAHYGYLFGLDSLAVASPDTAPVEWNPCHSAGDSVRIELGENIRFSARYYVSVRLQRRSGGNWGPPSGPSSAAFCAISTPSFTWEPIVYFRNTGAGDTVWAFNDKVALWHKPGWLGGTNPDTVEVFQPSPPPPGFIPVSVGYRLRASEPGAPFLFGIAWDSIPHRYGPEHIGLYTRLPSGGWKLYHRRAFSAGRNLVWVDGEVEGGFADSDAGARGSDPLILMVDTLAPVCSVLSPVSEAVVRAMAVSDSVRIRDNCVNVAVTFLQARGDTAPVVDRADTLVSRDTVYRTQISSGNVQAAAGARAHLVVSDGANRVTINLSRQVYRAPAGDIQTPVNRWTPLRTTAVLDTPLIIPAMVRAITGGGYDNTKCRIYRWFDSTAVTDSSTRPHTWVEYAAGKTGVFALEPGKLMWIRTRQSVRLNMGNGRTVSLRDTVKLVLPPNNWTDFALPYGGFFAEYLGDILNATGANADSLQFYRWALSGNTYSAHLVHAPVLAVDTFNNPKFVLTSGVTDGYTVYNPLDVPVTLYIPPVCTGMSVVRSLPRALHKTAPGAWALTLRPRLDGGVALGPVVLGYVPSPGLSSVTGCPPAPTFAQAGVRVYDRQSGVRYGHLLWRRTAGDGVAYELEFYNDGDGPQRIEFTVDGVAAPGDGALVMLGDPATGAVQPVTEGATFAVDVPAGTSVYRMLTVGGAGYHTMMLAKVQPLAQFSVFSGPSRAGLTVQFMLPADVGRVEYRLVDAAGRLVWRQTDRAGLRTGMNRTFWRGAARPGLYVLQVAVYDTAGRRTAQRRQPLMMLP